MKLTHLAWAAGIVVGEGCIFGHKRGTITLSVSMCDVEVLHSLKRIFGGSVSPWIHRPNATAFRRWSASGITALTAISKMRPWLSSVKLADFTYAKTIAPNAGKGRNWAKGARTHCSYGHPFRGRNLVLFTGPHGRQRVCRTCRRRDMKAWYARNKHTKFWRKYRKHPTAPHATSAPDRSARRLVR